MKTRYLIVFVTLAALLFCSKKEKPFVLAKSSPAYNLAKELAQIESSLDPDSNKTLVITDYFDITTGELIDVIYSTLGKRADQLATMTREQLNAIVNQNAQMLAENKMMIREAKKRHIKISTAKRDSVLDSQYKRTGSKEDFLELLRNNSIGFDQFVANLEKQLTINAYLEQIREESAEITEDDIQNAYTEMLQDTLVSVRHILLLTEGKSDNERRGIRQKLEGILSRARKSEPFEDLAKLYSEDPGSKEEGGLYTDFNRGTMVKPFEDAAFSLKVGEISDIVETAYGLHIIKSINRRVETRPVEELRAELEKSIKEKQGSTIIPDHLEELRQRYHYRLNEI